VAYADRNVMKIYVEINDENIRKAASIVMKHYKDKEFLDRVRNVTSFYYTDHPSEIVSQRLPTIMDHLEIYVRPYRSVNPFSRAIAHAKGNEIFINTRKLHFPFIDRVETIYHESTHLCGYSHNGNRPTADNLRSVPYLTASLFAKYIQEIYI
jgi:hypothetical protein